MFKIFEVFCHFFNFIALVWFAFNQILIWLQDGEAAANTASSDNVPVSRVYPYGMTKQQFDAAYEAILLSDSDEERTDEPAEV